MAKKILKAVLRTAFKRGLHFVCMLALGMSILFFSSENALAEEGALEKQMLEERLLNLRDQKKLTDEDYIFPTYQTLSHLYWLIGLFDINDDMSVDNFLRINECNLYSNHHLNEFEWKELRNAGRRHIAKNIPNYPSHFKTIVPIELGKYNDEKKYFDIKEKSIIENVKRIIIGIDNPFTTCIKNNDWDILNQYPPEFLLNIIRPISLRRVPTDLNTAQKYIEMTLEKHEQNKARYGEQAHYARKAYVLAYISALSHKKEKTGMSSQISILGTIDKISVYADPELEYLLYETKLH